ncbi:uncharacterized protein LTR77_009180 [Saxophila tyrrhenica]|uniref:Uncharacterized protein n=1 Tax=Saxophila tyrrhenica TaxID=1690608 RepID=A0AAV9P292_9PEZI|nr:hypothetical protein LTR77_009180 [Saxophila tyrrhenica]
MAVLRSLLSLTVLAGFGAAAPVIYQQTPLLTPSKVIYQQTPLLTPSNIGVLDEQEWILRVNTTFDAVNLKDKPIQPLESYGYLDFHHYSIFDPKAAAAAGKLNKSDVDCAVTQPNALLIQPGNQTTSAIIQSNATALEGTNLNPFFDFVSLSFKPLAADVDVIFIDLFSWTIKDGKAENVEELYVGFLPESDGSFLGWDLEPRAFIDGWGKGSNWVELRGYDEDFNPMPFCVDNIVVEYHKTGNDE